MIVTLKFLAFVFVVYLGLCGVAFLNQRAMIYYPTAAAGASPAAELRLDVDGAVLRSWIVRRETRRALLYFGGNAEDVSRSVASFSNAINDRTLVFVNYRGYGGSTGEPSEDALVGDALALFDRLAADHDDIAVVGRSLGSGVAMQLAARRPVRALVLVTPFDSLVSVGQAAMPWLPVKWLARDRYDSLSAAEKVTAKALVIVATDDGVVPPLHARRLLAAFKPGFARAVDAVGYGHNDVQLWPTYLSEIAAFVDAEQGADHNP